MFMGVARDYMELINGKLVYKCCTVEDGVAALKIVDACRQSSATGRAVHWRSVSNRLRSTRGT